jgi:hypothetical protein
MLPILFAEMLCVPHLDGEVLPLCLIGAPARMIEDVVVRFIALPRAIWPLCYGIRGSRSNGTKNVKVVQVALVYPRIVSTDVNDLICKTNRAVRASGIAAQRITSVAWKRRVGGIMSPSA